MSATTSLAEHIRRIFCAGPRNVIAMADEVLELAREHGLRIEFRDGLCHVQLFGAEPSGCEPSRCGTAGPMVASIPKSAVRALIARIGTLSGCDSPYEGATVLPSPEGPQLVHFLNTPDEQWIEIGTVPDGQLDELERRMQNLELGRSWEEAKSRILGRHDG